MKKVGIFGSAFGPPTLGHKDLIQQSLQELDEVWLIPSFAHGFGKKMFPYYFRMKLTEVFAKDLDNEAIIAKDIESKMPQAENGESVYTYDLLSHLQETIDKNGEEISLYFIMGPDNADAWSKFYKSKEISERWNLFIGKESKQIRSTIVRNRLASGESILDLVTPSVENLMKEAPAQVWELIRQQAEK